MKEKIDQKQVAEIVREAGKLLLNRHIEIRQKGNASNYVTSCDIAVQEFLSAKLKEYLPGSLVIGEESDDNPTDGEWLWIIDPIDGTSNFIRDIGMSAISVGLGDFAHSHLCSAMSLYDKRFAPPCFRIIDRVYQEADDLRRLGSAAVELVYLACGRVELHFEIRLFPGIQQAQFPSSGKPAGQLRFFMRIDCPWTDHFLWLLPTTRKIFRDL